MANKMREYVVNATAGMVAGLVAGMLGGVVGGTVLGLVLVMVTNEGLTVHLALFVALIGGAIGVPIGVITGMLKAVICRGTVTKVTWIVVSGLGAGLGARLYDEPNDVAIIILFTVLGAIIAGATVQCLTVLFSRESGEEVTTRRMIGYSIAFSWRDFSW